MSEEERGFKITDRRGQEKEESKAEVPKKEEPQEASSTEQQAHAEGGQTPPVDFQALCFSITTSAMISMGVMENPQTKKKEKDLNMAKQQVDVLDMLKEKTKGNLTEAEEKFLTDALYQLRMVFVEASK